MVPNPAGHNTSKRADKNASYELELSATRRPSRKSTRISGHRQKPDSPLRITEMNRMAAPSSRATRSGGKPNG